MIREIMKHCIGNIKDQDFKIKAEKLMRCPKNKKWFGIRLFKLLNECSWTKDQMIMLANELKAIRGEDSVNGMKLRSIRSKLSKI